MSMDPSSQLLLGPGPLSEAVSAAMHAVPSGNVYWGDAHQVPTSAGLANDQDSHQHDAVMQQHMAGTALL